MTENQYRVTINDIVVPIDYLADYILRISAKLFPRGQKSIKKTAFLREDLLLVLQSIPNTNDEESIENLRVLLRTGYYRETSPGNIIYSRVSKNNIALNLIH